MAYINDITVRFEATRTSLINLNQCEIKIYEMCNLYLNATQFRLSLQQESVDFAKWKDAVEKKIKVKKSIVMVYMESFKCQKFKEKSFMRHFGATITWKKQLINSILDIVLAQVTSLVDALEVHKQFINLKESLNGLTYENARELPEYADICNQIAKIQPTLMKEEKIKEISELFPLQYHVNLIKESFECREHRVFQQMLQLAKRRFNCYSIEVPYIGDIEFIQSKTPEFITPPGFEVVPFDINEPYLIQELRRLQSFTMPSTKQEKPVKFWESRTGVKFSNEDLKAIDHTFVYLAYKKTHNHANAIVDVGVVIADELEEPAHFKNKYYSCKQVPINLYTGVQATEKKVPYLCFRDFSAQERNNYERKIAQEVKKEQEKRLAPHHLANDDRDGNQNSNFKHSEINEDFSAKLAEKSPEAESIFGLNSGKDEVNSDLYKIVSYLSDIKPIVEKWVYVRPDHGYKRLNVDLRQTPTEFLSLPNMFYTYLQIKSENDININLSTIEILESLFKLEQELENMVNVVPHTPEEAYNRMCHYKSTTETQKTLIRQLKIASEFIQREKGIAKEWLEFLHEIIVELWQNYVQPYIIQIEHLKYMNFLDELSSSLETYLGETAMAMTQDFNELFKTIIRILEETPVNFDVLFYFKIVLYLGKFYELSERNSEAMECYQTAITKLLQHKAWRHARKLKGDEETIFPGDVTANQKMIDETWDKICAKFAEWNDKIELAILDEALAEQEREAIINSKYEKKATYLSRDEIKEQKLKEIHRYRQIFFKESEQNEQPASKPSKRVQIGDYEALLNALYSELLICWKRTSWDHISCQNDNNKVHQVSKIGRIQAIFDMLKNKNPKKTAVNTNKPGGKSLGPVRGDLQSSEIDPKKESQFLNMSNQNYYERAVCYATLASREINKAAQDKYFDEAFKNVEAALKYEQTVLEACVNNAEHIFNYLHVDLLKNKYGSTDFPLNKLDEVKVLSNLSDAPPPVILKLSGTSVTLKVHKCHETGKIDANEILYGLAIKEDDPNGTVPQISWERFGLGERPVKKEPGIKLEAQDNNAHTAKFDNRYEASRKVHTYIFQQDSLDCPLFTIPNLKPNQKYQFASASLCYETNTFVISKNWAQLLCASPVYIPNILFYMAKIAFYFENYPLAIKFSRYGLKNVLYSKSQAESFLDYSSNPLNSFYLDKKVIYDLSLIDLQNIAEALMVLCRSELYEIEAKIKIDRKISLFKRQYQLLEKIGIAILSAELSVSIGNFALAANAILFAYSFCGPFLKKEFIPGFFINALLKMHLVVLSIPNCFWSKPLNALSSKLVYEISKCALTNEEYLLFKRVLYQDLTAQRKKIIYIPSPTIHATDQLEDLNKSNILKHLEAPSKLAIKGGKTDNVTGFKNNPKASGNANTDNEKSGLNYHMKIATNYQNNLEMFIENIDQRLLNFIKAYHANFKRVLEDFENSDAKQNITEEDATFFELLSNQDDMNVARSILSSKANSSFTLLEFICLFVERSLHEKADINLSTFEPFFYKLIKMTPIESKNIWEVTKQVLLLKEKAFEQDLEWSPQAHRASAEIQQTKLNLNNNSALNESQKLSFLIPKMTDQKSAELVQESKDKQGANQKGSKKQPATNQNTKQQNNPSKAEEVMEEKLPESPINVFNELNRLLGSFYSEKHLYGNFEFLGSQRSLSLLAKFLLLKARFLFHKSNIQPSKELEIQLFEADIFTLGWELKVSSDDSQLNQQGLGIQISKIKSVMPGISKETWLGLKEIPAVFAEIFELVLQASTAAYISKSYALFQNIIAFYYNFLKTTRMSSADVLSHTKIQTYITLITENILAFLEDLKTSDPFQLLNIDYLEDEDGDLSDGKEADGHRSQNEGDYSFYGKDYSLNNPPRQSLKPMDASKGQSLLNTSNIDRVQGANDGQMLSVIPGGALARRKKSTFNKDQSMFGADNPENHEISYNVEKKNRNQKITEEFLDVGKANKQWWERIAGLDFLLMSNVYAFSLQMLYKILKPKVLHFHAKKFLELTEFQYALKILPLVEKLYGFLYEEALHRQRTITNELQKLTEAPSEMQAQSEEIEVGIDSALKKGVNAKKLKEGELKAQKAALDEEIKQINAVKESVSATKTAQRKQTSDYLEKLNNISEKLYICRFVNLYEFFMSKPMLSAEEKALVESPIIKAFVLKKDNVKGLKLAYSLRTEIIDELKKQNEYSILVFAQNKLARLYLEMGDLDNAEKLYVDSVNTTFQTVGVLNDVRELHREFAREDILQKWDPKSLHICILSLYDLTKFIFKDNLSAQNACYILANMIVNALFGKSLPRPLGNTQHCALEILDFDYGYIFENEHYISVHHFITALEHFLELQCVMDATDEALQMANYLHLLSTRVTSNPFMAAKSKAIQIKILSRSGMIKEAIKSFRKCTEFRFCPLSDFLDGSAKKIIPSVFLPKEDEDSAFQNDITPFDERNKKPIEKLMNTFPRPAIERTSQGYKLCTITADVFIMKHENFDHQSKGDKDFTVLDQKINYLVSFKQKLESNVDAALASLNGAYSSASPSKIIPNLTVYAWQTLAKYEILFSIYKQENFEKHEYLKIREIYLKQMIKFLEKFCANLTQNIQLLVLVETNEQKSNFIPLNPFDTIYKGLFKTSEISMQSLDKLKRYSEFGLEIRQIIGELSKILIYAKSLIAEHFEKLNQFSLYFERSKEALNCYEKLFWGDYFFNQPWTGMADKPSNPNDKGKPKTEAKGEILSSVESEICRNFLITLKKMTEVGDLQKVIQGILKPPTISTHMYLKIKMNLAKSLFLQNRHSMLFKYVKHCYEMCDRFKDQFFKKAIKAIEGRAYYQEFNLPQSLSVLRDANNLTRENCFCEDVLDSCRVSLSMLGDLGELEYLMENYYESIICFFKVKERMILKSSFFDFLSKVFKTRDYAHVLDNCLKQIHSFPSHNLASNSNARRSSKHSNEQKPYIPSSKDGKDFGPERQKQLTSLEKLRMINYETMKRSESLTVEESMQDLEETEFNPDYNSTDAKLNIFVELQENQNEIRQVFNTPFIKENTKDKENLNKLKDKKTEKSNPAAFKNRSFRVFDDFDFKENLKYNTISVSELAHNNKEEFQSIYNPKIEIYMKTNLRIMMVSIFGFEEMPNALFTERYNLIKHTIGFCERLYYENSFLIRKNYFLLNSHKAQNEFYYAKLLKIKAKIKLLKKEATVKNRLLKAQSTPGNSHGNGPTLHINNEVIKEITAEFIQKHYAPILVKAKEKLVTAMTYLRSETVLNEFGFNLEEVFFQTAEIDMWLAAHVPIDDFKFISVSHVSRMSKELSINLSEEEIQSRMIAEKRNGDRNHHYNIWFDKKGSGGILGKRTASWPLQEES